MKAEPRIKRALVSVSNKEGIVEFVKGLQSYKVEIISTGGTAKALQEAGIKVTPVSKVTKFPEMMDGRVKTLHPAIHGGLLALRGKRSHMNQIKKQGIKPIDMVVVNLYPFAQTVAKKGTTLAQAIENIDIGGPSMIRSAAKNFESVTIVTNPARYKDILKELEKGKGATSRKTRLALAKEAFRHTAEYDTHIFQYLAGLGKRQEFPDLLNLSFTKIQDLRYGENPHQKAAYYKEHKPPGGSLVLGKQLHGKELSFNNILDMEAAWKLVKEFALPAAVIIKHNNPCGVALGKDILEAYSKAYTCDPVSAFGGIVAANRVVDVSLAKKVSEIFVEVLLAPAFDEEAMEILTKKKDLRLIYIGEKRESKGLVKDYRKVDGGLLAQDEDNIVENRAKFKAVTKRHPTKKEWEDLLFAWKVAKHAKSNTIVYARDLATVGIGAGQMSRIDAAELGVMKAKKSRLKVEGSVIASDAFTPFPDVVEFAAKKGVTALIQPGGSIRDNEVTAAANKGKVAMVFTGIRHFRH